MESERVNISLGLVSFSFTKNTEVIKWDFIIYYLYLNN